MENQTAFTLQRKKKSQRHYAAAQPHNTKNSRSNIVFSPDVKLMFIVFVDGPGM